MADIVMQMIVNECAPAREHYILGWLFTYDLKCCTVSHLSVFEAMYGIGEGFPAFKI